MDKKYRPKMLHPLGFEGGKPVPVPKMFQQEGENVKTSYSEEIYSSIGEQRMIKPLKDFKVK